MAFPTLDYNLGNASDVPGALGGQAVQSVALSKSITTAMLASGIVTALVKMPAGTRYVGLYAKSDDLDTNGSPALAIDIGIAGVSDTTYDDVDAFGDALDVGQAGTSTEAILQAGMGLTVPVDHYVTFTAATAAATAAAGTFTLGLQAVLP